MSSPDEKRALTISGTLHVVGVVLLLVASFVSGWRAPAEELEFELIDEADLMAMESQQATQAPAPAQAEPAPQDDFVPLERMQLADLPQVQPVELPPLPAPEPEPEPEPEPTPAPKPEPKPKPVETKPAPKPEPKPEPQKVSFDQFRRTNPIKEQPSRPAPQPKPVSAPRLQTGNIAQRLNSSVGSININMPASTSGATQAAVKSYAQVVRERLQAAFQAVGTSGLEAQATFTVTSGGQFTGVRISRSSGNSAFDGAVLDAFRRARSPGPPPDGQSHTWQLTFTAE
ncbi:MAG: energy transducer TonB [Verrucomicrobiota bacterium JB022]|nr:energy transducer TonB [Verrucomicrobiota bacterium JB022]